MWKNNPESEDALFSAMQEQNLSQETREFVQYVLTPVTTEWRELTSQEKAVLWSWSEDLEWSTEDAHEPNWMEVTFGFNVPSPQLVSTGHFRDAVKDVRESMLDWPEGTDWDAGHAAQWYSETDEAAQYAEDLSGRAAVLCERWNSDLLKVDIAFVQASREQLLLQKYIPLGLNYKFHGYVDNYRLEMTYDGKPVHSVWDEQEKVLIQYNVNGYDLGDEAIDLTVEYENGQPSRLRIVDDDEKDAAYAQEKPDSALLSLLQPNGWAGMTISEYQRLSWTEHDTPEDIAALQALSSDREFYESRDSDADANYYFNVYEPLTASQWRTRSWDGTARSVMDGHVRMEYSMSLTILDADRLTVGEYDAARASMQTELDGILEKYADQEKDALKASVAREVEALSEKYGGEALEIRVEYILEVENSEKAEPAAPDDREPRAYAPGTEEEYASLLQIMPQEQDTVADFNRALLAWSDADYERMERISEDANRNDIRVSLTEAERRFVRLTAELSGVENAKQVQSDYTGRPLEDPVFDGDDFWKQSEDGLCWCNLWYQFSYHIADPETLTVGERDRRVSGMLGDIEDFWNGASLDELLSGTQDLKKTLADIAGRYSDDQMTLKIEPGRVSFDGYDNRNRA